MYWITVVVYCLHWWRCVESCQHLFSRLVWIARYFPFCSLRLSVFSMTKLRMVGRSRGYSSVIFARPLCTLLSCCGLPVDATLQCWWAILRASNPRTSRTKNQGIFSSHSVRSSQPSQDIKSWTSKLPPPCSPWHLALQKKRPTLFFFR